MSKSESKTVRNIDLNFQAARRHLLSSDEHLPNESFDNQERKIVAVKIDSSNEAEFPSLNPNSGIQKVSMLPTSRQTIAKSFGKSNLNMTQENFPALISSSQSLFQNVSVSKATLDKKVTVTQSRPKGKSKSLIKPKPMQFSDKNSNKEVLELKNEDFPALPVNKKLQKNLKLSVQKKNAPMIEYSSLAKAHPKLNVVRAAEDEIEKQLKNGKELNIDSDINFPSLKTTGNQTTFAINENLTTATPFRDKINPQKFKENKPESSNGGIFKRLDIQNHTEKFKYIDPSNETLRNQVRGAVYVPQLHNFNN